MAARDEYIEATREARDALYDLLMMTEPDTGRNLRLAYSDLKRMLKEHEGEDPEVARAKAEKERAERERRHAWRTTSNGGREAYVFQYLGEERLTIRELLERMKRGLHADYDIYESDIRSQVNRMFKAGQLQREGEQWHSRFRYRYFQPRDLEGPIADLQAALNDVDAGEEG